MVLFDKLLCRALPLDRKKFLLWPIGGHYQTLSHIRDHLLLITSCDHINVIIIKVDRKSKIEHKALSMTALIKFAYQDN